MNWLLYILLRELLSFPFLKSALQYSFYLLTQSRSFFLKHQPCHCLLCSKGHDRNGDMRFSVQTLGLTGRSSVPHKKHITSTWGAVFRFLDSGQVDKQVDNSKKEIIWHPCLPLEYKSKRTRILFSHSVNTNAQKVCPTKRGWRFRRSQRGSAGDTRAQGR